MCLGIPGRVVNLRDDQGLLMGTIDFGGVQRDVCFEYLSGDIKPGDYAIVHVGFAISRIDEQEARRTYEALREMSQLDELDWLREVAEAGIGLGAPGDDGVQGSAQ